MQPIVLVDGDPPFFADHPQQYIDKLWELHARTDLKPGTFHTMIGQLQDVLEQGLWREAEEDVQEWLAKH